jgi:uncharacterized protein (TIGR02217 family)
MNLELPDFVSPDYGLRLPVEVEFHWATAVVSYGLKEQRNQIWSRPKRSWSINWAALKATARAALQEFFGRAHGKFRPFYYTDRDDYACGFSDWSYTAAGGETTVQLGKDYYKGEAEEWSEDKKAIVPAATYARTVKIDAATLTEGTEFTLDSDTGIIDFTGGSAPNGALSAAEVVTADYQFYFVVRFREDRFVDRLIAPGIWRPTFEIEEVVT